MAMSKTLKGKKYTDKPTYTQFSIRNIKSSDFFSFPNPGFVHFITEMRATPASTTTKSLLISPHSWLPYRSP